MDERAAFEANIDANPSDWQNHLVYADWLADHGEQDESDFRRSIGEWHKKTGGPTDTKGAGPYNHRLMTLRKTSALPQGVNPVLFQSNQTLHERNAPHNPIKSGSKHYWQSYRGMEEGFRRAFMANRPKRMSRRGKFSRRLQRYYT